MWTFEPILKTTIWGGDRIASYKGIATDLERVGESWELSAVEGDESVVASGPHIGLTLTQLVEKYGASLLGKRNFERFGTRFPLLIKFIDAREDLSVQVHPDDALARKRGFENGKTEMWYVLEARRGATLISGFSSPVSPLDYRGMVEDGTFVNVLRQEPIHKGDVFFIPAGRVHAIGAGAFLAEIQQTSNVTYRIYDYHRKDADGKERELHTEEAYAAIDFNDTSGRAVAYQPRPGIPVRVVTTPYFTTNILTTDRPMRRNYSEWDSFVVLIVTGGSGTLTTSKRSLDVEAGTTVLIAAEEEGLEIMPDGDFEAVETYIC